VKDENVLAKLTLIVRDVLEDDELTLSEGTTADDVKDWDSTNHVRIMIAAESEFGICFETDEITSSKTVGELVQLIQRKLQQAG